MTYNFDPDKWYDNELAVLLKKLNAGQITQTEFDMTQSKLELQLETMWQRLDGTYRINTAGSNE